MLGRTSLLARNATKSMVRFAGSHGGIIGQNLPFSLKNKYRITAWFWIYSILGFGAPFFILKHQLLKK